jgi:hypothetical protein
MDSYTLICDGCGRRIKLLLSNRNAVIVATCCNHDKATVSNHMRMIGSEEKAK